ncbi:hypothetical protein Vretimale_3361 [Volvox reticuliferus]|uniref:Uncharacterized protein n=1 Tax=Volvox reticuliferus TaxID=1737510 RepID=A0A8J4D8G9_9CHLO|nr:hypothetical protein Vretimale_3361 [Volvox reticuliferus]
MAAICLKTQPQRLMPVLFLLNLVYASQTTIVTLAEFLATACNALNDATVVPVLCSFSPGNWSISQPPPAVLLRNPKTTITGSVVEPRRVGTADTTEYGTWLNLPATIPEPLLNIPPNSTLTLANLKITGALLQLQLQPGLPNPGAITLGPGAQLQLLNVHVSTSCKSLAAYQVFVCQQQQLPSPNFNVDYGTLTYLSYTTPALELVNVTITCGSADEPVPEPDCLSVVAAAGADVLAVVGRRRPEAPFPDQSMPIFVHITRNFTLMPPAAAAAAAPVTAPSTGLSATVEVEENAEAEVALSPPPVTSVLLTQDLLFISGSSDIPTWLDLSGSESLIRLADNARVVLQDLTLVGLPMGPARAYPLGLLRIPVWTFDFQRIAVGTTKKRLTLRNLRLALTPAEVAALAHDLQGPGVPAPASDPWVPFCACNLVIFGDVDLGLATAPQPAGTAADQSPAAAAPPVPVPVVGLSLFLRKASTAFGSMLYMENVLLDASAMSSEAGVFDWRQEPLCQLLPFNQALDEPPQFPIDVKGTVLKLQGPFIFPISMNSDRNKPYFILTEDSALLVGPPPPEGTITFSQLQAYIIGVSVLLGDPVRPRLLNTYQMPAAVNLRQPSASLTLRSLILTNLSVAGVHPLSTASTASRLVRLHSRGLRQHSYSSSSSSSSSPPWPPPPPSRSIQAPAGRDPTGGLPRGLANFTSCLWILDFDRNVSGGGGGGDSGGDSSGAALLDSVVIVVPHPEFALLRWLLSHNDTAPVTDAAVAEQLRDMLNRSILATRGGGGGVGASYGSGGGVDSADGTDGVSLTFKTLHWCGLAGRNVTVKSVGSSDTPPGKGLWAPLGLGLPVSYPFSALGSLPAGAAEPSLPPPPPLWRNGSSSLMDADAGSSGDSWVIYVAVICGVAAGLLVALLLCIMVVCIVRRHRRRRRLLEHVNELNVPSPPPSMIADIACAADNNGTAPCSLRTPTTHRRDTAVNVCDPAAGSALPAPPDSKTTSDGKLPFAGAASAPPVLVAQGPAEEPRLSPTATMAAAAALRPLSSAAIGGGGGGGGGESLGTWCDMTISGLGQLLANREFSDTSLSQGTVPDGGGDGGGPAAAALGAQTTAALTSPNVTTHSTSGTVSPTPRAQPAVPSAVLSTTVPSGDSSSMVEAATVNHQKREVLLLRQIALSLHTRMIRTREAVADGRGHASAISDTETPLGPMGQCDSTVAPDAAPSAPRTVDCPAVLDPAATLRDGDASADLGGGGNPAAAAVATDSGVLILTGELGRGAQGVVYSGRWRGINVAVKSLLLHLPVGSKKGGSES